MLQEKHTNQHLQTEQREETELFVNTYNGSFSEETIFSTCSGNRHIWDDYLRQKSVFIKTLCTTHTETNHISKLVLFPALSYRLQSHGRRRFSTCTMNSTGCLIHATLNRSGSTAPLGLGYSASGRMKLPSGSKSFPFVIHKQEYCSQCKSFPCPHPWSWDNMPRWVLALQELLLALPRWSFGLTARALLHDQSFLITRFISVACRKS